ncbi:MAG: hypothetical protein ACP5UA_14265 [Candidatus Hydrogenedens sp.]
MLENIVFDFIISKNNFLKLIISIDSYELDKVRKIIAFCGKDRKQLKELHSYETIIIKKYPKTKDTRTKERFQSEAIGDVKIFSNLNEFGNYLEKTNNKSTFSVDLSKKINSPEIIKEPKEGSTLYVVMSPELINTLKVMYTHNYSNLCIIYTYDDSRVNKVIEKIK